MVVGLIILLVLKLYILDHIRPHSNIFFLTKSDFKLQTWVYGIFTKEDYNDSTLQF